MLQTVKFTYYKSTGKLYISHSFRMPYEMPFFDVVSKCKEAFEKGIFAGLGTSTWSGYILIEAKGLSQIIDLTSWGEETNE